MAGRTRSTALALLAGAVQVAWAMDRTICNKNIVAAMHNGTLARNDSIFFVDQFGPMSRDDNIGLTIEGCEQMCGKKADFYTDAGVRLSTWLIPVIILIGNMHWATLNTKTRLLSIIHLVGDPIDSAWSLITKLEVWNRCYDMAEAMSSIGGRNKDHVQDRATILAAIQELEGPGSNPQQTYNNIIEHSTIDGDDPTRPSLHFLCREIANELSDSNELLLSRTWLAVLSYVFTVLSAFVEAIGGTPSSQPGGRIGTAMFMSWLLPVVLLSNTVGCFTSRRTCLRTMERFAKSTKPAWRRSSSVAVASPPVGIAVSSPTIMSASPTDPQAQQGFLLADRGRPDYFASRHIRSTSSGSLAAPQAPVEHRRSVDWVDIQLFSQDRPSKILNKTNAWSSFSDAQPWSGAIYTYQPVKWLFSVEKLKSRAHNPITLLILSILPFLNALIMAFLIIWFTPTTGLTCRHFPLIAIFCGWIFSVSFTAVTSHFFSGKYHWRLMLVKDTLIAIPSLLMIFLSSAGMFNSCWCWSAVYSRGLKSAVVLLDPDPLRKANALSTYPSLVGTCLGVHVVLFLTMLFITKRGRSLLRRSEKIKDADFWKLHRSMGSLQAEDEYNRPENLKSGRFRSRSRGQSESEPLFRAVF